ncbi:hypothetical protein LMANV2_280030 [Leptospira interrogans serovar Manilae]|uniref:Uncharacterized protein n=1 Tax=Leptospira interrogans serovar Manilae TaxID=214675 RepID=A0AAQ1NWU6_LEPIR|nr:hypothetical protein LMANV2_280030 [Leptospira interrogans serovar Manilae]
MLQFFGNLNSMLLSGLNETQCIALECQSKHQSIKVFAKSKEAFAKIQGPLCRLCFRVI